MDSQKYIDSFIVAAREGGETDVSKLIQIGSDIAKNEYGADISYHQTAQSSPYLVGRDAIDGPIHVSNTGHSPDLNWAHPDQGYGPNKLTVAHKPPSNPGRPWLTQAALGGQLQQKIPQQLISQNELIWTGVPVPVEQGQGKIVQKLREGSIKDATKGYTPITDPVSAMHNEQAKWMAQNPDGFVTGKADAQGMHGSSTKEFVDGTLKQKDPVKHAAINKYIKAGLLFLGTTGSFIAAAAPGLEPIDLLGRAGEAAGLGYGKTALGATGALAAAAKFAPQVAKSIVNVGAKIAAPLAALDIGMGMSNITKDQMQKAGPRDRSAIAYSQNTGTSIPKARRQYDNMQQSFLSGGATKYNWDQFDPKNYF